MLVAESGTVNWIVQERIAVGHTQCSVQKSKTHPVVE